MNKEEMEMKVMNSQVQMIAEQIERIDSGLMEIEYLKNNLDELKKVKENTEIFTPVSNGIFIKAKLEKMDKLLVNVGNGVVVEKTVEETKALLSDRISELEEARESMLEQMQKIEDQLGKLEK